MTAVMDLKSWRALSFVLGIIVTLLALLQAADRGFRVPYRLETIEKTLQEANVGSHEPRIRALEASQAEISRKVDIVVERMSAMELSIGKSMTKIETLITSMTAGVEDARIKAADAKQSIINYQVEMDNEIQNIREE